MVGERRNQLGAARAIGHDVGGYAHAYESTAGRSTHGRNHEPLGRGFRFWVKQRKEVIDRRRARKRQHVEPSGEQIITQGRDVNGGGHIAIRLHGINFRAGSTQSVRHHVATNVGPRQQKAPPLWRKNVDELAKERL